MADLEINILGWIVFAVFTAVILLMFLSEIVQPFLKKKSKDKA